MGWLSTSRRSHTGHACWCFAALLFVGRVQVATAHGVSKARGYNRRGMSAGFVMHPQRETDPKCWIRQFPVDNLGSVGRRVSRLQMVPPSSSPGRQRENEIKRKILRLKKEGKLGKNKKKKETEEDDNSKVRSQASAELSALEKIRRVREREGKTVDITKKYEGKLRQTLSSSQSNTIGKPSNKQQSVTRKDEELGLDEEDDDDDDNEDEKKLVDLVARKLEEKRVQQRQEEEAKRMKETTMASSTPISTDEPPSTVSTSTSTSSTPAQSKQTTTGVGGSWTKPASTQEGAPAVETYKPSRASWGAFPRPKDISKAYGGGRRVGAGVTPDSSQEERRRLEKSAEKTRERLRAYREKAGIEVQSEKDNRDEIDDALALSGRAMQRGLYGTAVSALEKVTQYCSTNSKVGGKVYLELAMAYEAVGRTSEAITVYSSLTNSRIEDIKHNAKRLLYGIEAINFMRNEARDSNFSRKKVSQEFIDCTGLANIADNFDKVYNTAYVDMDNPNFYKRLTESVVRSPREARLVLLKATNAGEVDRLRIIQALRVLSRDFDEALGEERDERRRQEELNVALIDGVPIAEKLPKGFKHPEKEFQALDKFSLGDPAQMMENLDGEWRLQLVADRNGDGVKFYNTTLAWQRVDASAGTYDLFIPVGFVSVKEKGNLDFDDESRAFSREEDTSSSGGWFDLQKSFSPNGGPAASCQQIVSVDSELCVMRLGDEKFLKKDTVKEYFSVWRRVERGTFSEKRP